MHYTFRLDVDDILEKIGDVRRGGMSSTIESKGAMLRFSDLVDYKKLNILKNKKNGLTVVKLYRRNCAACEQLAPAYEQFAEEVYNIQSYLSRSSGGSSAIKYDEKRRNRLTDNNIRHAEAMRHVSVVDCDAAIDSDIDIKATPAIVIMRHGQILPITIDDADSKRFVQKMMRIVDNLNGELD